MSLPDQSAQAAPVQVPAQSAPVASPPPQKAAPSQEQVKQAIKDVQEVVKSRASSLEFSVDHASGKTIIKRLDTQSGDGDLAVAQSKAGLASQAKG